MDERNPVTIAATTEAVADLPISVEEFTRRLAWMKQKMELTQKFFKEIMVEDTDYGMIPGAEKPCLLKPGAEKMLEVYGYAACIKRVDEREDPATGFYEVQVTTQIVDKRTDAVVAEGVGSANTFESKYRYRWVFENELPPHADRDSLKTRTIHSKKHGRDYIQYRIENDDLWSLRNTILKMAAKRSLVDATLRATRSSGLFTQDLEDLREWAGSDVEDGEQPRKSSAQRPQQAALNWTPFWTRVRKLGLTEEQVRELASSFFDVPMLKSLKDVPGLSQDKLDSFAAFLENRAQEARAK